MPNDLKEIPFKQGSTSTMLSAVCALFMFLTFLSYNFYHLFTPSPSLREAENTPGYVLLLPQEEEKNGAIQDPMLVLNHMLSYLDDVIAHQEFTMKSYSSILPLFLVDASKKSYVEVRLARQSNFNDTQFRQDLEGIIPGVKIETRGAFFGEWTSKLSSISNSAYSMAIMMFTTLCISVIVLIGSCFKMHENTIQTLRFLGASQSYITKKFQNFFSLRFFLGSAFGLLAALVIFTPFAWVLDPTVQMPALLSQALIQLLIIGGLGYTLLFVMMRALLTLHAKRLA